MAQIERRHGETREPPKADDPPVDALHDAPKAWASAVGNQGVQRIASSAAGQQAPVGPESIVGAAAVVARQPADGVVEMPEETITPGGGAIEMPEETITPGGGAIEMPEETIVPGGGSETRTPG